MKDHKITSSCDILPSWKKVKKTLLLHHYGLRSDSSKYNYYSCRGIYVGKKHLWLQKHIKTIVVVLGLLGCLFLIDSFFISFSEFENPQPTTSSNNSSAFLQVKDSNIDMKQSPIQMYDRLLNMAGSALAEKELKQEPSNLWAEPYQQASLWKPCADKNVKHNPGNIVKSNGYISVSANGGLNQQRVAICNAVAVASLLNATLVMPKFLYSNVWKDPSQFGDIYQEDYFTNILKDDIRIVKELPPHMKSQDLNAVGSQITDADLPKEATSADYIKIVLPILLKNGFVHFLGYGNRLGFDPLPFDIQRLRCKCNFHALKFAQKIQQAGSLLIKRIRKYSTPPSMLDTQLLGKFIEKKESQEYARGTTKYLALHLRFEIDMVAYSLCEFGGGENERKELQAYRESHFPLLLQRLKNSTFISAADLRKLGRCPLTPEEAGLVLAGLGFKRSTYIYLASSQIYGGTSRMDPFTRLYPNVITKENLLTPTELAPFRNFSSQLAALDFIVCASADVFAMTDSGSQLSSLVSGLRTYYGSGHAPTLRPNKKRLSSILSENGTIGWNNFKDRIKKMIQEAQKLGTKGYGKSIYRHPRCQECMCKLH
ncbi:O-fucosyltransferase 8 isoform X1 [Arachis stenosperma]|uniref:O-fucosyltransferase 8 isoform X1 n=1 Tax=Arachis stenosperma TaxID=217475 RepID=UPI0025ABD56F|nr:O-fucosyltransferase 8 isoform X1 [Arachis stenosperma]XP_057737918.1 O-fucosyltransferase 8 isoform X1 [Arachis stenosperma]